jgi:hypothetical protein
MIHGFRLANIIPSPNASTKIPVMMLFRGLILAVTEEIISWNRIIKEGCQA